MKIKSFSFSSRLYSFLVGWLRSYRCQQKPKVSCRDALLASWEESQKNPPPFTSWCSHIMADNSTNALTSLTDNKSNACNSQILFSNSMILLRAS